MNLSLKTIKEARLDKQKQCPDDSYNKIPIKPGVKVGGIPASFLYGFQNSSLEARLRILCFESLSKEEKEEICREREELASYRKSFLAFLIKGLDGEIQKLQKPSTPVSQKLENKVFKMELEITRKVLSKMSRLNKNVLEREFSLLEACEKPGVNPPNIEVRDSQMIMNFFDQLKAVTEAAIVERERNNIVFLNQAS